MLVPPDRWLPTPLDPPPPSVLRGGSGAVRPTKRQDPQRAWEVVRNSTNTTKSSISKDLATQNPLVHHDCRHQIVWKQTQISALLLLFTTSVYCNDCLCFSPCLKILKVSPAARASTSAPAGTKKLMTNVTSLVVADMVAPFQEAVRMDMSQRPTTRAGAQQLPAFSVQTQAARHAWRKVAFWMWKDRRWILRKMWKNVEKCGKMWKVIGSGAVWPL